MPRELDPFREYVEVVEKGKWRCRFCGIKYGGSATRIRAHLAGIPRYGIKGCEGVDSHVRAQALSAFEGQGSGLGISMGGTSGKGTERTVFGASQNVLQSDYPSNPNDTQNLNQPGCAPQQPSCYWPTRTGTASACPQYQVSLPPGDMPLDNLDTTQQPDLSNHGLDGAHGNIMDSSLQQILMDLPASFPLDHIGLPELLNQSTHLEAGNEQQNSRGLSSSQSGQVLGIGTSNGLEEFIAGDVLPYHRFSNTTTTSIPQYSREQLPSSKEQFADGITSCSPLYSTNWSNFHDSPPENLVESRDVIVNTPDQLHPRYDKEYGNDACSFASQTPMDIDPPRASQHTTDSHIIKATIFDSQVLEASTNTTGPSSSQDMNRVSPIMNVRSIYSNDEEIKNLKRKVEELDCKEAVIKEQMEIEFGASSVRKKPRIVVQKWLNEIERARNNFQMIGQANAEILPPTEKVETLMREVEELIEQKLPQTLLIEARDAKGNAFLERKLIGEEIHRNIELIWNRLKENNECKLGIYGMGGVGKTTIMMHVHNRLLKDATFGGVLFITVSQDFSIYKLQSDVWKALKFGIMEDEHEKKRAAMLSEHLERKRNFVLILDDVWQHFKLQDVGIPERDGLKVVLTTRFSEVCSRMDCEEIKIQPLGEEEAWKLFEEELGTKLLTNKQVEKVARKIANRCAGLPLAINTMASSMRGEKNVFVWQDTLNKLERSHTKHTEMGDKVLPVLKLSYERLSDPQVKQCFVLCALFPEDSLIKKNKLIEYFIDEGFLDELDTREEQYCRGLAIVDKLRNACLLEVDYYDGIRMHDLMREMALDIMNRTYMVKAGQGLRTIPNGEHWTEDLEKVSLMWGRIKDIPPDMSPNCPKLSTLLLNGSLQLENMQLQDSFFMKLQGLKVLNLSECAITKLPDSLSELANLQALLLRNCGSLIRIPYLGKLKYLRKLDAMGCQSLLVVEGLEELSNLRYLDLSTTSIERSWEGTFSRMVNLQYLKITGKVKAEEVIRLKALKRLECNFGNVDNFNEYVRFMERSGHNHYVLIVDQEKSLWFVSETVYSDPEILPENEIGKSMEIRSCNYAMARAGEERNNDSILIPGDVESFEGTNWCGMSRLRYLKALTIVKWDDLMKLFGGAGVDSEEIDNTRDSPASLFPSVHMLKIRRCSKLKYLFGHESRFSLPLLCEGIGGMNSSVASPPQTEESDNMKRVVGSEWLPHFPSLTTIEVMECDNIRELFPHECLLHFPNLEKIIISSCEKLEEIIRGGPLPSGVTCGRLRYLEVNGCNNMKRVLLMQDMLLHLPFLEKIIVEHCEGIEVIIGAVANTTHTSFPKLTHLTLSDLPELKSICQGDGVMSCDSLKYLDIWICPKLKRIPVQLPLLDNDNDDDDGLLPSPHPSLQRICIHRQTWESLEWDHPHASSSLQHLVHFL